MKLDLTGGSSENFREAIIPIEYNGNGVAILSPQAGFFHTSMTSPRVTCNGELLEYNTDYRYAHRSKDIRNKYKISAHASIILLGPERNGQIEIEGNFIGGSYQLYKTKYLSHISTTEYLLSLYDPSSLTDMPDILPPRASILDMEAVSTGMLSSVQIIYTMGMYLKDYEADKVPASTGFAWPELTIESLDPPVIVEHDLDAGAGSMIPLEQRAQHRLNMVPLGAVPLGMFVYGPLPIEVDETVDGTIGEALEVRAQQRINITPLGSAPLGMYVFAPPPINVDESIDGKLGEIPQAYVQARMNLIPLNAIPLGMYTFGPPIYVDKTMDGSLGSYEHAYAQSRVNYVKLGYIPLGMLNGEF